MAIEIENKIWKIWSTHPASDRKGYRLTELLAQGSFLMSSSKNSIKLIKFLHK